MDPTIPLGIGLGIGSLLYTLYLVKGVTQEFHEESRQSLPILLPEQAVSAHQPKPNIAVRFAEAWREVKAEKEVKLLPPLKKVQYVDLEEEEEWFLQPEEEEPEEESAVSQTPSLAPTQSIAGDIPIDLLESHSKREYYELICDISDKAALHYKKHGKITRDGMVPSALIRREWDHCLSQPNGIFWKSGMLETQNGVTVMLEDCDEWLHLFLREKGYVFTDGIYNDEENES